MKNNKVFLVIQGHTSYVDQLIENVKNVENVIWSTETDIPDSHLDKIRNSNIKLVITEKPTFNGYGNVNIQVQSTMQGLYEAKKLGATHVIKLRSDLIFSDPSKFINEYPFDSRIHQLSYIEHTSLCIPLTNHYPNLPNWVNENYPNFVKNVSDYNYIADFTNLGPIDEMINFWSLPFEESENRNPAEFKFLLRYLKMKNYDNVELTYEYLSNIFGFFMTFCKETDNPLTSLKRGWNTNQLLNNVDVKWVG
jgi:hypothetical protein